MKLRWQALMPFAVWLIITVSPVPGGLVANQWRYFAVFAAAITGLVFEAMPAGAVGIIAVAFVAVMRYVEPEPAKSMHRYQAVEAAVPPSIRMQLINQSKLAMPPGSGFWKDAFNKRPRPF